MTKEFVEMRTFIKSCFSVAATGLLLVSAHAGAAQDVSRAKDKADEAVKACREKCKSEKSNGAEAYEGCMLQCDGNHDKDKETPSVHK